MAVKREWNEIQARYEAGDKLTVIADQYLMRASSICIEAKRRGWDRTNRKEGWIRKNKKEIVKPRTNRIRLEIKEAPKNKKLIKINDIPIHGLLNDLDESIKQKSKILLERFIEVTNIAISQTIELMNENPNGLHISSQGNSGIRYSRNTQFINDLIPLFIALKAYVTENDNKTINFNTQINGQVPNKLTINTNPLIASKQYQDFIK